MPKAVDVLTEHVSDSRIRCWQQCRLRFYFRYVARIERPSGPALQLGKAVHAVLQQWNLSRWRGEALSEDQMRSHLHGQFVDSPEEVTEPPGEDEVKAWSLLEAYFQQTSIPADEKPQGVEVTLELDLADHGLPRLVGVLDLVRPGGLIVDFKTSAQSPRDAQVAHQTELQLTCYAVLYREATGQTESGFELHHLIKTKQPKVVVTALPPINQTQESRLYRILDS